MKSTVNMNPKGRTLLRPYRTALMRFLGRRTSANLHAALELGKQAVELGLETLDLALIHERALPARSPAGGSTATESRISRQARVFFAEAIIAMEATHRSAVESNAELVRLNRSLQRRTRELARSNRQLKKEVARRRVVEETLRQSKQHAHQLLAQSRHLQEQMRRLSRRVLSVQEEERRRISRELHDVIAQMLTGINVRLTALKGEASAGDKGLERKITSTQRLVEKSVNIVHRFARELRPAVLDDLGLIPALKAFTRGFSRETGLPVHFRAFAGVEQLSNAKRTVLYRVVQEALSNVARHAGASEVEVNIIRHSASAFMQVVDNGQSFDVDQVLHSGKSKHLGLLGMRERVEMVGGVFTIVSKTGHGTVVGVDMPWAGTKRGMVQS
jgi:signal transduction histidine kinase